MALMLKLGAKVALMVMELFERFMKVLRTLLEVKFVW